MSSLIPIKIAELAIESLNEKIKQLEEENARIKEAGRQLSLKIHRSKSYAEFYPTLGDFEKAIGIGCSVAECPFTDDINSR